MLWPYRLQSTPQPTTTRPPDRLAALYGLYGRPRFSPQRVLTRSGWLIVWHGLADQEISPRSTLAWWGRASRQDQGTARVNEAARLFLVPGLTHCRGSVGPFILKSMV